MKALFTHKIVVLVIAFFTLAITISIILIVFLTSTKPIENKYLETNKTAETSESSNENPSQEDNSVEIPETTPSEQIQEEENPKEPEELTETPKEIVWGNTNKKQVIFTFDGGSGTQSIENILSALKKHDIHATFFTTGKWAEQNPDEIEQIDTDGHEIFNHTYDHPHLTEITDTEIIEEFQQTEDILQELIGKTSKPYFRPPYGERNAHILDIAATEGYRSVYWTVDALDWKESEGVTASQVKQRIYDNLENGAIYLMHIGDNITGEILDEVFTYIENKDYKIVSLTEGIK